MIGSIKFTVDDEHGQLSLTIEGLYVHDPQYDREQLVVMDAREWGYLKRSIDAAIKKKKCLKKQINKKKYLLCPGWVTSQNDGEKHFISARQLLDLHGVSAHECITTSRSVDHRRGLIRLAPRKDGNYTI